MLFQAPAGKGKDPIGLHAPFASACLCSRGNPAGVAVVVFDIIGPCDPVAQLGQRVGRQICRCSLYQCFGAGGIVVFDMLLNLGAQCGGSTDIVGQIALWCAAAIGKALCAGKQRQVASAALYRHFFKLLGLGKIGGCVQESLQLRSIDFGAACGQIEFSPRHRRHRALGCAVDQAGCFGPVFASNRCIDRAEKLTVFCGRRAGHISR